MSLLLSIFWVLPKLVRLLDAKDCIFGDAWDRIVTKPLLPPKLSKPEVPSSFWDPDVWSNDLSSFSLVSWSFYVTAFIFGWKVAPSIDACSAACLRLSFWVCTLVTQWRLRLINAGKSIFGWDLDFFIGFIWLYVAIGVYCALTYMP